MKNLLKTLTIVLALGIATTPADAQNNCALRDTVVERLETKYSESLVAGGIQGRDTNQVMVEVWANRETGTFTALLTNPQGISCVVATGTDFFTREAPDFIEGDNL